MNIPAANFTNQLLIAMPGMADPRFTRTLTYVFQHNDEGAIGLVVNRPLELPLRRLLQDIRLPDSTKQMDDSRQVLEGGPVQQEMGFVLHRQPGPWAATRMIADDISLTSSRDILDAISQGKGPSDYLVVLGYAGWSAGQLEQEMAENAWLTCPADAAILFDTPFNERWQAAANRLGVDMSLLSVEVGHA